MRSLVDDIDFDSIEFLMFVLDEMAEKLSSDGVDVIKLTLGKAQEPLHPAIVAALIEAVRDPEKRNLVYPEGLPQLRQKIADWYTDMGNQTFASSVLINTGTSPFFKDLFRLIITEGDEVLIPEPYYSVYYVCALLARAKVTTYAIDQESQKIDQADFLAKYNPGKTRFVVTCSPGNPYGNILSADDYQFIIDSTDDSTYIVADEIYRNTGFYGRVPSILDVADREVLERVIVTNAFSKGFRMYASRVGFSILPKELLRPMRVLLQHTLLTTNPVEQFGCLEALNHLDEVDDLTRIYRERAKYVESALGTLDGVEVVPPAGGFYVVVLCDKYCQSNNIVDSFELSKNILESTGVAVVPGSDFGVAMGIRLSLSSLRFTEAIDRLYNFFS